MWLLCPASSISVPSPSGSSAFQRGSLNIFEDAESEWATTPRAGEPGASTFLTQHGAGGNSRSPSPQAAAGREAAPYSSALGHSQRDLVPRSPFSMPAPLLPGGYHPGARGGSAPAAGSLTAAGPAALLTVPPPEHRALRVLITSRPASGGSPSARWECRTHGRKKQLFVSRSLTSCRFFSICISPASQPPPTANLQGAFSIRAAVHRGPQLGAGQ